MCRGGLGVSDGTRCGSVGDIEQVRAWAEQDHLTIIIIGHVWDVVEHRRGERWGGACSIGQVWTSWNRRNWQCWTGNGTGSVSNMGQLCV